MSSHATDVGVCAESSFTLLVGHCNSAASPKVNPESVIDTLVCVCVVIIRTSQLTILAAF